ncbi:MAG: S41 family peptidase [Zoogloeaceae bacterium]|jgi:carboxyl-terminal processing protease|nr:S41 family peptidase [Zoogloeaceae bacterium]
MGITQMNRFKLFSLILLSFIAGVFVSAYNPAVAQKDMRSGLPVEDLRLFAEVFNAIKQGYVEPVEDKKMIANAISGMLSNLDPHSAYLDTESFKELQVGTQGEFGGLGIEVGMEDGLVKVISPIEDTPAFRAGVKAGDLIFKLDDEPVKGIPLTEAVKKMRGKPGTKIRLSIFRKSESKPVEVSLTREIIKVQSVKSRLVEPGYAWVRITQFQENTIPLLAKHLKDLYRQGELKGLVLDLRNDPGGLLHGAVGVSAAFLPANAKVVSINGRVQEARQAYSATPGDYARGSEDFLKDLPEGVKKVPLVVLVNGGSASASEIVAGALQDHKRAVIMGTQTFGKGSVQTILPLPPGDAAIKLTTARYYTPSGRSIQAKGIVPDIVVREGGKSDRFAYLREADLMGHLENDRDAGESAQDAGESAPKKSGDEARHDKKDKGGKGDREEDDGLLPPPLEYASASDQQFQQALNLLKGLQIMSGVNR